MRPILDKSWTIAMDRQDANEKDLEALSMLLLEEGRNRMPRHQRHMAKMAGNEKNGEWIEMLHNLSDVAVVETMSGDELEIRIFTESVHLV